jgi:hypothetical protein
MAIKSAGVVRIERAGKGLIAGKWIIVLLHEHGFPLAVATRDVFDSEEAARERCARERWVVAEVER